MEKNGNITSESSPDIEQTKSKEIEKDREVHLGAKNTFGGIVAKNGNKTITSHLYREKGINATDSFETTFSQSVVDYDNAYLELEKELIDNQLLSKINKSIPISKYPRLVKLRGTARFFDWNAFKILTTIGKLADLSGHLESEEDIASTLMNTPSSNIYERCFSMYQEMLDVFSLGQITCFLQANSKNIASSLNEEYLCMTIEQLRTSYVMSGDVRVVITGFIPSRATSNSSFPGIAGQVNMSEIAESILGEDLDLVIDPIAIYTEIQP